MGAWGGGVGVRLAMKIMFVEASHEDLDMHTGGGGGIRYYAL